MFDTLFDEDTTSTDTTTQPMASPQAEARPAIKKFYTRERNVVVLRNQGAAHKENLGCFPS